jgi:peptide/nickel transport system substrate-binding protein
MPSIALSRTFRLLGIACATGMAFGTTCAAHAESVLRVAMSAADIPDWTGAPDQGYEGYRFVGFTLYDSLINWELAKNTDRAADIRPGLAVSWAVDPNDHRKWIFKLRHGVTFHDGCDWNADSAIWNFRRVMDPKSPQYNVRHHAMQSWTIIDIDSMEKIDDYTIAAHTKLDDSLLPYEIAGYFQISNCAVTKLHNDYAAFAKHPYGTGPYMFDRVVPHERLELVKNPNYWDKERIPKQDRLVLLPMPEASTRAAALLAGQVDFIEAPSPDTIPRLKQAGMQIITAPYPHNWDYQVRVDRPPFNDIRVRQAANYAINRDEMVDMLQGVATPGYGKFIPSQPWYGHPVEYKFNLAKAKELLKEAGCLPCKFTVGISTSGSGQMQPLPMNELVKEQLEAAGFQVTLAPMDWNSLIDVFIGGAKKYPQYDAINVSLSSIEPVQGIMKESMTRYQSPNGENWGLFSDKTIDALGTEALSTFDGEARDTIISKMHETLVADAQEIYIVHDLNPRALSPKVHGFVQAQSWFQDLTPITISP